MDASRNAVTSVHPFPSGSRPERSEMFTVPWFASRIIAAKHIQHKPGVRYTPHSKLAPICCRCAHCMGNWASSTDHNEVTHPVQTHRSAPDSVMDPPANAIRGVELLPETPLIFPTEKNELLDRIRELQNKLEAVRAVKHSMTSPGALSQISSSADLPEGTNSSSAPTEMPVGRILMVTHMLPYEYKTRSVGDKVTTSIDEKGSNSADHLCRAVKSWHEATPNSWWVGGLVVPPNQDISAATTEASGRLSAQRCFPVAIEPRRHQVRHVDGPRDGPAATQRYGAHCECACKDAWFGSIPGDGCRMCCCLAAVALLLIVSHHLPTRARHAAALQWLLHVGAPPSAALHHAV